MDLVFVCGKFGIAVCQTERRMNAPIHAAVCRYEGKATTTEYVNE
jgi:hypothetical protein